MRALNQSKVPVTLLPGLVFVLSLMCHPMLSANQDDDVAASKQFAAQKHDCGLDHGYQCRDMQESNFLGLEADQNMVPAVYLSAWQIALADFVLIEDLSDQEKQLQHYKIGFSENPSQYVVHFQSLLLPRIEQGQSVGIMRGTFGRTARYWISKSTMAVEKRLFYK